METKIMHHNPSYANNLEISDYIRKSSFATSIEIEVCEIDKNRNYVINDIDPVTGNLVL